MATIRRRQRKKGTVYEVIADVGRDYLGNRKQESRTYPTLREAKVGLAKWVTEIENGTSVGRSTQTVADILNTWHATEAAHKVRPSTHKAYREVIDNHLLPGLGHIPVQKLTPLQVKTFYSKKLSSGCSPGVLKKCHQLLHQSLTMALLMGLVPRNVTEAVSPPAVLTRKMQTWTPEEVETFREASRTNRLWPLWEIALTTGMRRGELLGLRWQDVDFEERTIWVRQNVYRRWIGEPKSRAGVRSIPLPPAPLESLREHRRRQNERRLALGSRWQDTDHVFCTEEGGVYYSTNVNLEHDRIIQQCGVSRIRFHDIRHTYATLALAAGIPAHVVSAILGHANIRITLDTYAHVIPAQYQEVRERIEMVMYSTKNRAL